MRDGDYKILATMTPQKKPGDIADAARPDGWSIMQFIKQAELDRFQVFNLRNDPAETTDLVAIEPERAQKLRDRMIKLHAEIRSEGPLLELDKKRKN